jgi:hypothetical protein
MSNSVTVSSFFSDKYFDIPRYQRGYSWETQQIIDLFDDIKESVDFKKPHYLGTIVISPAGGSRYHLIDGQQRVTTIIMIIDAIADTLDKEDEVFYRRAFIKGDGGYKLLPSIRDREFFEGIIEGVPVKTKNKAQSLLAKGYEIIKNRLEIEGDKKAFLNALINMKFVVFEDEEEEAARIFLTVNDRGKPLTNMDKVKGLLIYYSCRFLKCELDDKLNENFSDIFEAYEDIKHLGEELGIYFISRREFNEDTVMSYHFSTFNHSENYTPTAEFAFEYLKNKLSDCGKNGDFDGIRAILTGYGDTLASFTMHLRKLVEQAGEDVKLYKLFVTLNLSPRLYPMLVVLDIKDYLHRPLSTDDRYTYSDVLEVLDVMFYKTIKGRAEAWLRDIVWDMMNDKIFHTELENRLLNFGRRCYDDAYFRNSLRWNAYDNSALIHIFITYCEHLSGESYNIEHLKKLLRGKDRATSLEHILSQTPDFNPAAFGFEDKEDYEKHLNSIGNLTLLEQSLNSEANNRALLEKRKVYSESAFSMTRKLSAWLSEYKGLNKAGIEKRAEELIDFCVKRWKF